jgi:hypothetical protein
MMMASPFSSFSNAAASSSSSDDAQSTRCAPGRMYRAKVLTFERMLADLLLVQTGFAEACPRRPVAAGKDRDDEVVRQGEKPPLDEHEPA